MTEGAWCSQIHHHPIGYNIQVDLDVVGLGSSTGGCQENMGHLDHDIATKYIKLQLHQIFYYAVCLLESFLLQFCAISSGIPRCFAARISAVLAVAGLARCGVLRRATAVKKKGVRVVEGKDGLMQQNSPSQIERTRCILDQLNRLFGN